MVYTYSSIHRIIFCEPGLSLPGHSFISANEFDTSVLTGHPKQNIDMMMRIYWCILYRLKYVNRVKVST